MEKLPLYDKQYLRVRTPQTTDGVNLRYTEDERIDYKETHLPLTARKFLEAENENLPKQLQHKIDVVDSVIVPAKKPGRPAVAAKHMQTVTDTQDLDDDDSEIDDESHVDGTDDDNAPADEEDKQAEKPRKPGRPSNASKGQQP